MSSRITLPPFGIDEKRKVAFDFAAWCGAGVTVSSATASSVVYSGTDASPDIINGATSNSGTISAVTIGGDTKKGTLGVVYDVTVLATLSDGQIIPMSAFAAFVPDLPAGAV